MAPTHHMITRKRARESKSDVPHVSLERARREKTGKRKTVSESNNRQVSQESLAQQQAEYDQDQDADDEDDSAHEEVEIYHYDQGRKQRRDEWYETVSDLKANNGEIRVKRKLPGNELRIVKTVVLEVDESGQDALPNDEIDFMSSFQSTHPNILPLIKVGYRFGTYGNEPIMRPLCDMYLPFCSGGDLEDFAHRWPKGSSERPVSPVFTLHTLASLSDALAFLQLGRMPRKENGDYYYLENHKPLLHCDIKMANVFLRWRPNPRRGELPDIVLGDFGLATPLAKSRSWAGTRKYWAPEVEKAYKTSKNIEYDDRKVITPASDVYSMAATVCKMISRENSMKQLLGVEPELKKWPRLPRVCPDVLSTLKGCLTVDPAVRRRTSLLWNDSLEFKKARDIMLSHGARLPRGMVPDHYNPDLEELGTRDKPINLDTPSPEPEPISDWEHIDAAQADAVPATQSRKDKQRQAEPQAQGAAAIRRSATEPAPKSPEQFDDKEDDTYSVWVSHARLVRKNLGTDRASASK